MTRPFTIAASRTLATVAMIVLAALLALPSRLALAAPAAQDEPTPLLLGEFVRAPMAAGDSLQYSIALPVDGDYTITYTADDDPANFNLTVTDADGQELYNDVMGDVTVALVAGDYILQVDATEDGELGFAVATPYGTMSDNADEPGELINGGHYTEEEIDGTRYATLTIEESPYPQQAIILVQGGEGDVYQVELTSDEGDYVQMTTDSEEFLRFVTSGGAYDVTLTPIDGGSELTLVTYLSGPAPVLPADEEVTGDLIDDTDKDTYRFEVTQAGALVDVVMTSDSGSDTTLAAGLQPEDGTWSGYGYGEEPATLQFVAPVAGDYYIEVYSSNSDGDTYTLQASEGDVAPTLPVNEPVEASTAGNAVNSYLFDVTEPDQFVIAVLVGAEDVDLDLAIEQYDETGALLRSDSSYYSGSNEIVGVYAPDPGQFIVTVKSYSSDDAGYTILATTGAAADVISSGTEGATTSGDTEATDAEPAAGNAAEQWASDAGATSQYGLDDWSAQQATGEPNATRGNDDPAAWAAEVEDSGEEQLTLSYATAVVPSRHRNL